MIRKSWILWFIVLEVLCVMAIPVHGKVGFSSLAREASPGGQVIDEESVTGILESHLQRTLNDPRKRVEVRDVRVSEKTILPPGAFSYEVLVPDQAYRGGNVAATLVLRVNGKEVKKLRVMAQIDIFMDVITVRSYLKKQHVIEERDLQWVNKNIASLPGDVIMDADAVLGKRTTLSINGREVLRKGMLERTPLVKKGDRVLLVIENQQFKIMTFGEVQEEGGRGDRIRLLNSASKREVYGRVIDANTARIDF